MNKIKKFMAVIGLLFLFGCSDSDKLAGTAVEPNEMAENVPNEVKDPESSSSVIDVERSSSSEKVLENESSSSNKGDNNTLRPGDIGVSSSSITPVEPVSSSSARSDNDARPGGEQSGTKPGADLSGYGAYYGVSDASFDSVVVASTVVYGGKVDAEIRFMADRLEADTGDHPCRFPGCSDLYLSDAARTDRQRSADLLRHVAIP